MKRIFLTSIFVFMAFVSICAQKTVVWEQPIIGYTKYNYFSIQ